MSSQRGNASRSRPQAHQNQTAFHHNKASRLTKKIAEHGGRFQELLCPACKQILDWRKSYRKYKPLTVPKKCTRCGQKAITQAYHAVCPNCARAHKICAKCCQPFEASVEPAEAGPADPVAALMQQFPQLMKDGNMVISERQLRSALRQMQKEEEAGSDDDCECSSCCSSCDGHCECGHEKKGKKKAPAPHQHQEPAPGADGAPAPGPKPPSAAPAPAAAAAAQLGEEDEDVEFDDGEDDGEEGEEGEEGEAEGPRGPGVAPPPADGSSPFGKSAFSKIFQAPPIAQSPPAAPQ